METDNLEEVLSYLKDNYNSGVIALDGACGAGKTNLAIKLSKFLELPNFDLDSYIENGKGCFVNAIRFNDLKQDFKASDNFVVSGVCIRAVFEILKIPITHHIYVKARSETRWEYLDEIETNLLESINAAFGLNEQHQSICMEVRDYHRNYEPHKNAHVTFVRGQ